MKSDKVRQYEEARSGRPAIDDHDADLPRDCSLCRHLRDVHNQTCEAFPGGIPAAIALGSTSHHMPYPGDGGLRFSEDEIDLQTEE